jgi:hypothetical protein
MSFHEKKRQVGLNEMMPFRPQPDWYETYWMTDRLSGWRLKLSRAAAAVSLPPLLVAWIA